jgi:hypothetical protein
MSRFITRIELHSANAENYQTLHEEMAKEGFTRTIISSEKIEYDLPNAEYYRISNLNLQQILESAKKAAAKTNKTHSIIVSETSASTWHNLNTTKK